MQQETVAATFTIYPLFALLAVYAAGWWVIQKNHFAWEHGRWSNNIWDRGAKEPRKGWKEGGFSRFAGQWEMIWLGSVLFGTVAALLGGLITHNPYVPYLFGTFGFIGAFTGWTDLWTRLAPIEMSHLGLYALLPPVVWGLLGPTLIPSRLDLSFIFGASSTLYQFGFFALLIPGFFWILSLTGGIGQADVRGLWMAAFAFAWWVDAESMILLALASIGIQALAAIPAHIFKWGEVRKSPFGKRKSRAIPWLPAINITFTYGTLLILVLPPLIVI